MGTPPASFNARLKKAARLSLGRFARAEDGATAVEFALLLAPFMLLFFGLIELALVFFASMVLENAVIDAGREIRTGQLQTSSDNSALGFRSKVCSHMSWLENGCTDRLRIDVKTVATFAGSAEEEPPKTPCWNPGGPSSLVLVRAYYDWPLITPLMASAMQATDGKMTLGFTTGFANEPYNTSAAPAVGCQQ